MLLFESESIIISLDIAIPCLEWVAKAHCFSEEFRESEWESLKQYEKYKQEYPKLEWFVDARNVEAISPEDVEWVAETILPKFAEVGLTKEAFVMPSDLWGQVSVEDYQSEAAGGRVQIHLFDSVEAAKRWLKQN